MVRKPCVFRWVGAFLIQALVHGVLPCQKFLGRHVLGRAQRAFPERHRVRNPEKGAFARGALRKFVANCAPNLPKIGFVHQRKGAQNCRKCVANLKVNFGQFYANTPFPMPLFQIFLAWSPLQSLALKKTCFCANFGR